MITGEQFVRYTQALEDARKRGIENLQVKGVILESTASIPRIIDEIKNIKRDYGGGSSPEFQDFNDDITFLSNLSTGYIDTISRNSSLSASIGVIQQEDADITPNAMPVLYSADDIAEIDRIIEKLI